MENSESGTGAGPSLLYSLRNTGSQKKEFLFEKQLGEGEKKKKKKKRYYLL